VALGMENALDNFQIMLQIGAGTGLLFILRWFWWRINAMSEIAAMIVSFLIAIYFRFFHTPLGFEELSPETMLLIGVGLTTLSWIVVTFITRPVNHEKLVEFYRRTHPGGPGWTAVIREAEARGEVVEVKQDWYVPLGILCMILGCTAIYSTLFATGYWLYGQFVPAGLLTALAVASTVALVMAWTRLTTRYH